MYIFSIFVKNQFHARYQPIAEKAETIGGTH